LSEKKADIILTRQKWQRDEGSFQAIKYFDRTKEEILTWVAILFHDGKVDLYNKKTQAAEYLCHLEHEII
jgi:hypothetical protein